MNKKLGPGVPENDQESAGIEDDDYPLEPVDDDCTYDDYSEDSDADSSSK